MRTSRPLKVTPRGTGEVVTRILMSGLRARTTSMEASMSSWQRSKDSASKRQRPGWESIARLVGAP